MIKISRFTSFLLLIVFISLNAGAQALDDIVNKWITASGGKDKLEAIKSIYGESTVTVMGNEAAGVLYIQNDKGYRSETDLGGQKVINVVTDKGGWTINPFQGQTKAQATPDEQVNASQPDLNVAGPLFNYAQHGYTAQLAGLDTLDGIATYRIKLNSDKAGSPAMDIYVDASKYLVLKVVRHISVNGQKYEVVYEYSQFKPTAFGNTIAYTQNVDIAGLKLTMEYKSFQINKTIDPTIFEMPK